MQSSSGQPATSLPPQDDETYPDQRSRRYVFYFFLPLDLPSAVFTFSEPTVQAIIAVLTWLAGVPLWNLQQFIIAHSKDSASYLAIQRFVIPVIAMLTTAMALIALPRLDALVLGNLLAHDGEIKRLAIVGHRLYCVSPFFIGRRSFYHGVLITHGHIPPIRSASIAYLLVLFLTLGGLLFFTSLGGLMIAVWTMLVSSLAEVFYVG